MKIWQPAEVLNSHSYAYTPTYIYIHTYIHIHIYTHIQKYILTLIHPHTHAYFHICICICAINIKLSTPVVNMLKCSYKILFIWSYILQGNHKFYSSFVTIKIKNNRCHVFWYFFSRITCTPITFHMLPFTLTSDCFSWLKFVSFLFDSGQPFNSHFSSNREVSSCIWPKINEVSSCILLLVR